YRTLQKNIRRGWWTFAAIGVIFYLAISLMINQPTNITERPEYYPPLILMFLLMPVIYFHIFTTLFRQQQLHEMSEQEHILRLQVNHVTERVSELAEADEKFRIERHNFRHKMKAIASLVETEQYEELAMLVEEYNETLGKTQVTRYCRNAIIDAVLSSYIKRAESRGIRLTLGFAFPDPIPVNETELATAIANAIENAIHACEKLPEEKRFLEIKVISRPRFAIQIRNSFRGTVSFDEDGIPVNRAEDHGFGTRSIAAFCEKNNGYSIFKAENGVFTCYLNF
ncbi:MAG: sensor histidine kinase, partial [Clostridia bacterium]|nr:sensor histidine kinase [Clostridia bacterium]